MIDVICHIPGSYEENVGDKKLRRICIRRNCHKCPISSWWMENEERFLAGYNQFDIVRDPRRKKISVTYMPRGSKDNNYYKVQVEISKGVRTWIWLNC